MEAARMSGFIALHREAFDHPVLKGKPERFYAWFWLVSEACWKATAFDIRGKSVSIERGQLCTSRDQLAKAWNWSPSAVERFLTRLETEQMIGRQTGQGRTIITICNYDKYQDGEARTGQATGQPTGQKSDSHRTTKEEGNKGTKEQGSVETDVSTVGTPTEIDIVKVIFDQGRAILQRAGYDEKQSRSIIGRWRKQFGDPAVLIALSQAQTAKPEEPLEWITAALRAQSRQGNANGSYQPVDRRNGFTRAADRRVGFDQDFEPSGSAGRDDARQPHGTPGLPAPAGAAGER